jgi:hypothetical protein
MAFRAETAPFGALGFRASPVQRTQEIAIGEEDTVRIHGDAAMAVAPLGYTKLCRFTVYRLSVATSVGSFGVAGDCPIVGLGSFCRWAFWGRITSGVWDRTCHGFTRRLRNYNKSYWKDRELSALTDARARGTEVGCLRSKIRGDAAHGPRT